REKREREKFRAVPPLEGPKERAKDDPVQPPRGGKDQQPPPPPPPPPPKLRDVSVMVELENVKLHGFNPLLTQNEAVVIHAGGQTLKLEVKTNDSSVVGTMKLPEGTHKYAVRGRAEGKWWAGNGHPPRRMAVEGSG